MAGKEKQLKGKQGCLSRTLGLGERRAWSDAGRGSQNIGYRSRCTKQGQKMFCNCSGVGENREIVGERGASDAPESEIFNYFS